MNILITGVTSGLGRALFSYYADGGYRVAGCGRSVEKLATLPKEEGLTVRAVDVADSSAVHEWAEELSKVWGCPDLIINNAALINQPVPMWEVEEEEFSALIDVNIKGVFHVIKAFLPGMIAQNRGVIANLSSGWGRSTSPKVAPYCASKWAIEGLTAALAQELPAGLAAVAVNPGIINTPMLQSCFGKGAESHPTPDQWIQKAGPFFLGLRENDNGKALSV
ncbi:MAG: SDR family oxidoreductase [Opitutales bacterium]|nr:SDR family oxidoreductase [Opitutales bacterium]